MKKFTTWIQCILALAFAASACSAQGAPEKISNKEAMELVKTICEQYYCPLGAKGDVVVFVEVVASVEPWEAGQQVKLDSDTLNKMSSRNVRFKREQDLSEELDKVDVNTHVLRVTFYPFASSKGTLPNSIVVPMKNGDIQKWRHCLCTLSATEYGWKLVSVDQQ